MTPTTAPQRNIKGILFDMDGTLLDTETLSDEAIILVLQRHGVKLPLEVTTSKRIPWDLKYKTLGLRGHDWIPMLLNYIQQVGQEPGYPSLTLEEFWEQWERCLHQELASKVADLPGAAALVTACAKQGIPMAIATSSRMEGVHNKRVKHEDTIFQHMQVIVAGDDPAVQKGKPAPDIYLEAARRMNIDPEECLVFEDAVAGCQSGKAAGCAVVAIPDTRFTDQQKQEMFGPHCNVILESLEQFDGTPFGLDVKLGASSRSATGVNN